ncbi:hypothetical protein KY310_04555 [Candidatus Woesearchaeota archaeon]|nr:hypothetical protein [Candidatus Woesearchaeota archaeon]
MTDKPLEQILADFRQFLQTPEEVNELLKGLDRHKNRALTEDEHKALRDIYYKLKARGRHLDFEALIKKMDERINHDLDHWENKGPVLALEMDEAENLICQMVSCKYFADEFNLSSKKRLKRLRYILLQREFSNDKFYLDFRLTGSLIERVSRFVNKNASRFIEGVINLYDEIKTDIAQNKETVAKGAAVVGASLAGIALLYGIISGANYLNEENKKRMAERRDAVVQKIGGNSKLAEALINSSYDPEGLSQIVTSPDKKRQAVLYNDNQIFLYNAETNSVNYLENTLFDDISRIYWGSNDDLILVKEKSSKTTYIKLHMHKKRFIHLGGEVDSLSDISEIVYSPDKKYGAFFVRGTKSIFIFDDSQNYQLPNDLLDKINSIYWENDHILAVDTPNCPQPLKIDTHKVK